MSGCTASVGILTDDKIYVVSLEAKPVTVASSDARLLSKGNAGDSRTVLGVKGRAKPLSFDHKPQNEGK